MNSGSWSMEPFSQDSLLVAIALGLAAILAILTVIGMVVGARNKRARLAAEKEEQARIEALEADGVEAHDVTPAEPEAPAPAPTPAPSAASPPPPPQPAADEPAEDTPAPLADEPIAAAAPLDASPAAEAADTPAAVPAAEPVTRLKGLGPKIAARLGELGIVDVTQLAALSDAEAAALDAQLGAFQGRMERDRWREQAQLLAAGDRAGFEREFGKLG